MAEKSNLQSAEAMAGIFGLSTDQLEELRRKKVITGVGSPKKYDLIPTIRSVVQYFLNGDRYRTAAELADLFGFDGTRRIEQLKSDGVIRGEGKPTRYVLDEAVKSYVAFLSDKAYGREKKENVSNLEEAKLEQEVRLKTAKAEAAELELKELKGTMHRAEDVEAIMTDSALYIRSMLMAMPGKLAVDCANCQTAAETAERIKKEVHFILNSLTEYRYDPEEYKRRVRERRGWEGEHGDREDE